MRSVPRRSLSCLAAVALLLGLVPPAGCSFAFVRGAPSSYRPSQGPPPCKRHPEIPTLEFVGSVAVGLTALGVAIVKTPLIWDCGDESCAPPEVDYTSSKVLGLVSLGMLVSGVYGSFADSDCLEAHRNYRVYTSPE